MLRGCMHLFVSAVTCVTLFATDGGERVTLSSVRVCACACAGTYDVCEWLKGVWLCEVCVLVLHVCGRWENLRQCKVWMYLLVLWCVWAVRERHTV